MATTRRAYLVRGANRGLDPYSNVSFVNVLRGPRVPVSRFPYATLRTSTAYPGQALSAMVRGAASKPGISFVKEVMVPAIISRW